MDEIKKPASPEHDSSSAVKERKKKKKSILYTILLVIFAAIFIFSLAMLIRYYVRGHQEQQVFDDLSSYISSVEQDSGESSGSGSSVSLSDDAALIAAMHAIYEQNNDFQAWLTVPNTNINYPVMWSSLDPEYYLHRSFDLEVTVSGTPFIGEGGSLDSDCFIIYGHNMSNDTMFGTLDYYKDYDFWQQNQTLTLDTLDGRRTYQIFAAVTCRILNTDEEGFRYYYSAGDLTEESFAELSDWLVSNRDYDTGITPEYGKQIVILSTCAYHTENGRFIIAAQRIS